MRADPVLGPDRGARAARAWPGADGHAARAARRRLRRPARRGAGVGRALAGRCGRAAPRRARRSPSCWRRSARHRERLARSAAGGHLARLVAALERRLALLFRRHPLSPTATAAYVGLMQIDLQRLRGAARRAGPARRPGGRAMTLRPHLGELVRAAHLARGTRRHARLPGGDRLRAARGLQPLGAAPRVARTCAPRWSNTRRWRAATATTGRGRLNCAHGAGARPARGAARRARAGARLGRRRRAADRWSSRSSPRPPRTRRCCSSCRRNRATRSRASTRSPHAGPVLAGRAYLLPEGGPPQALPPDVLLQRVALERRPVPARRRARRRRSPRSTRRSRRARRASSRCPPTCRPTPAALGAHLEARRAGDRRARAAPRAPSSTRWANEHGLAAALGELALAAWLVTHVPELPVTEHFAWVTGWCADPDDARLRAALDARDLHYLLRFTPAPEDAVPPSVLRNPAWARPVRGVRQADGRARHARGRPEHRCWRSWRR